jgi:ElaA protein
MDWRWQSFEDLDQRELYSILAARQEVFTVGQNIRYQDADGRDFSSMHLSGWQNGKLCAYLRMIPLPEPRHYKVGRVLTMPEVRGQGQGIALMKEWLRIIESAYAPCVVVMAAQQYLEAFYQKFGFEAYGPHFHEAGLLHTPMRRAFTADSPA